jgi:phosphoglycerate-specific signal transduction histidine kinase
VLIFRATPTVQERIETLLDKQREQTIAPNETEELQQYEQVDDYLSFLNRLIRNLAQSQQQGLHRVS